MMWILNERMMNILEWKRSIGISRCSRLMQRYSASSAMTASPVPLTTHQAIDEGHPPYRMQKKRCMI